MKKLGLVGGMGPESTVPYYHDIVYGVQKKVGEKFFPNLTIESVNVFDVLDYCANKEYDKLVEYLMKAINNLVAAKADFIALSANTPHIVFDELKKQTPVPIVSIVESTAKEAKRLGMSKVGLLGTEFTMKGEFFRKPFVEKNIDIVIPKKEELLYVSEKISSELEYGVVKEDTQREIFKIIKRMQTEDGIEAVILGCTELPLLFKGVDSKVKVLDTVEIHIKEIISIITSN